MGARLPEIRPGATASAITANAGNARLDVNREDAIDTGNTRDIQYPIARVYPMAANTAFADLMRRRPQ